jgi:hypothetical protein
VVKKHYCYRVGFFAGGAARHPDPHLIISCLVLEQLRDDIALQCLKRFCVPEEIRYADQQIFHQRSRFRRALIHQLRISGQVRKVMDTHAPCNPPHYGSAFVV